MRYLNWLIGGFVKEKHDFETFLMSRMTRLVILYALVECYKAYEYRVDILLEWSRELNSIIKSIRDYDLDPSKKLKYTRGILIDSAELNEAHIMKQYIEYDFKAEGLAKHIDEYSKSLAENIDALCKMICIIK